MDRNPERLLVKLKAFATLLRAYRKTAEQEFMETVLARARQELNSAYGHLFDEIQQLAPTKTFGMHGTLEQVFESALSPFDDAATQLVTLQALDHAIQTVEVVQGRVEKVIDARKADRLHRLTRGPWGIVLGVAFGWAVEHYQTRLLAFATTAKEYWPAWKQGAFIGTGALCVVLSAALVNLLTAHGVDGLRARPGRSSMMFVLALAFGIAAAAIAKF